MSGCLSAPPFAPAHRVSLSFLDPFSRHLPTRYPFDSPAFVNYQVHPCSQLFHQSITCHFFFFISFSFS